jgi:hypothetical protein
MPDNNPPGLPPSGFPPPTIGPVGPGGEYIPYVPPPYVPAGVTPLPAQPLEIKGDGHEWHCQPHLSCCHGVTAGGPR